MFAHNNKLSIKIQNKNKTKQKKEEAREPFSKIKKNLQILRFTYIHIYRENWVTKNLN